jgi:thioredoxin-dependent peroxiredoxin
MSLPTILRTPTFAVLLSLTFFGCGGDVTPVVTKPGGLAPGDPAAPFALSDQDGSILRLSDVQKDWYLVLFLYRGYWCSDCRNQLLDLKKDASRFTAAKAALMAISTDLVEESATFNREWRFPFPLLSDPKLKVIDAYGVRHPKGHEGRDISRATVLIIDPSRTIRFKYVGKSPLDRPTNEEILRDIQLMREGKPLPSKGQWPPLGGS